MINLESELADTQRLYPKDTCYRTDDPRHHFKIHSYERERKATCFVPGCTHENHPAGSVTVTIVHGSDSSLPGVAAFGIDPRTLRRCDCGKWRWPTDEQVDAQKRRLAEASTRGRGRECGAQAAAPGVAKEAAELMPAERDTHRRQNGQGGVRPVRRATGEVRFRASLRGKHLGMFEHREEAEDAIKRAVEEQKGKP